MRSPTAAGTVREIHLFEGGLEGLRADVVALPLGKGEGAEVGPAAATDARVEGALGRALERKAFRGEEGEAVFVAVGRREGPDVLAVGTGEPGVRGNEERLRRAAGVAVRAARAHRARSIAFLVPSDPGTAAWQAAAEGLALGDWELDEFRGEERRRGRPPPLERLGLLNPERVPPEGARQAVERGRVLAAAQNAARRLVARPGNVATPSHLAERAEGLGAEHGLRVEVWGPDRLREEGFGALLAVAAGSAQEPRFIILEHEGSGGRPFVLVGKGVTFDSGGISLKPSGGMESMKYDMAGAAAVLGALEAVARLGLPRRVVGLVPATENLPSGTALKPGDVIRGVAGTSIEVVNTDAEGRLILSDALAYARGLEPRGVVDFATLTGGCVVALGHHAIGLMTPADDLAEELRVAGERTGERTWRLPLWQEYRKQLDSDIADIKNSGGREASPITAGWFLREFAEGLRWAHLDIAGTAWAEEERGWQPKGATGVGVRLALEWLRAAEAAPGRQGTAGGEGRRGRADGG